MTRKESLYKQWLEIQNADATLFLNREAPHNIEKMEATGRLRRDAERYTVAELEDKVQKEDHLFNYHRREHAHNNWLETEEGQKEQAEFKAKKEQLRALRAQAVEQVTKQVNGLLGNYGPDMHITRLDDTRAEVAVREHQFDRFDIYFDNYNWGEREPKFEVNVGCTGSFALDSERCAFYAQMGAFLGSADAWTVRQLLLDFNKFCEDNRKQYEDLWLAFQRRGTENL